APGAYLVIKFEKTNAPSLTLPVPPALLNTGFGLDGDGDKVFLFDISARGGSLLNSITFGSQVQDLTIGRFPNGGSTWALTLPTPGAANVAAALGIRSHLKVNEWMASPKSGDDWFELYNPDPAPINLAGLILTDDINDPNEFSVIPA